MADKLAWFKYLFENRLAIIGLVVSLGGWNGFQFWEKSEANADNVMMQNQITEMAGMITQVSRPVIIQKADNWGKYSNALESKLKIHERKFHGE